ncbi:MAG: sulfur oxygenase reductase family protein [Desulfuromonadaceae bacterium]|nr:sulfur oxygenase reductase family protein [Desulfuromonadaceae bacterium]
MRTHESPTIACSMARIVNSPESFETMQSIGPKVCIATASAPGFLGFQSSVQTGILPMAGRWGGGKLHMEEELNPIREIQYTMWESWQAHEKFHETQFDRVFELCGHCLSMVVEGPWEPVYEVVKGCMPPVRGMGQIAELASDLQQKKELVRFVTPQRTIAFGEHTVLPGHEKAFEKGAINTMEALADSPGFLGYMILKQIGVCALGSFMFDPASMALARQTLGAHPPKNPKPQFSTPDMRPTPTEYVIHSEWEAVEMGRMGFGRTLVNSKIRKIHDEGVVAHLAKGPYVAFFNPIMEEESWRSMIS